jgi:hypothetical protein
MAASLFSKHFLEQIGLHAEVRKHALQAPILVLKGFHLAEHRRIHAAVFGPPFIEARAPSRRLLRKNLPDSGVIPCSRHSSATGRPPSAWRKTPMIWASALRLFFIRNLLGRTDEKILLMNPINHGGDYLLSRRWVVERTFAWLGRSRWLAKDWEASIVSAEVWLLIAHIRIMIRRLARFHVGSIEL